MFVYGTQISASEQVGCQRVMTSFLKHLAQAQGLSGKRFVEQPFHRYAGIYNDGLEWWSRFEGPCWTCWHRYNCRPSLQALGGNIDPANCPW